MLTSPGAAKRSVGSGSSRPDHDFYETPTVAVTALLLVEKFGNQVWEPACGKGAISKVLIKHGHDIWSSDLYDWGYSHGETGRDFLSCELLVVDAVITNPPFKVAQDFAMTALAATRARMGKVALLNRIAWLESDRRREMFTSTPLSRVWVFSKRLPMMHRHGWEGRRTTSMIGFAWFVWDHRYEGRTSPGCGAPEPPHTGTAW